MDKRPGETIEQYKSRLRTRTIVSVVFAAFLVVVWKCAFPYLSGIMRLGVELVLLVPIIIANRQRFVRGAGMLRSRNAGRDSLVSVATAALILLIMPAVAGIVLAVVCISECIESRITGELYDSKAPAARSARKASRMLVPITIAVALLTFFLWILGTNSVSQAGVIAICVLLISSPSAFSYATPITLKIGMDKSKERGIIIKNAAILEDAHTIDTVVLDKTGTVTAGRPYVTDVISLDGGFDLMLAAAIEKQSDHPIAKAIVAAALENPGEIALPDSSEEIPGRGAVTEINGVSYIAGNEVFLESQGVEMIPEEGEELSRKGKSVVYFATLYKDMNGRTAGGDVIGMIALRDGPKPTSLKAVSRLENMGVDVIMLTGDSRSTAEAIKKEVGIDRAISEILPKDKDKVIANIQAGGDKVVAMAGDGEEDAAAIIQSDIGFAIGAGEQRPESADVIIVSDDLTDVSETMELSKKVTAKIKENIIGVVCYNVAGILIAAGALYLPAGLLLNPVLCTVLMCLSSIGIAANSMRMR